jgi:hypothetical protein
MNNYSKFLKQKYFKRPQIIKYFVGFLIITEVLLTPRLFSQNNPKNGYRDLMLYFGLSSDTVTLIAEKSRIFEYDIWINPEFEKVTTNYFFRYLPIGGGKAYMEHLTCQNTDTKKKNIKLVLKLTNQATFMPRMDKLGSFVYILQDDIGIFGDNNHGKIYWSIDDKEYLKIYETIIFDKYYYPNSEILASDPYAERIVFFIGEPNLGMTADQKSGESLVYLGVDNLPGTSKHAMHFLRIVGGNNKAEIPDFREDLWFIKGKGLVKLIHKEKNIITMKWTLKGY